MLRNSRKPAACAGCVFSPLAPRPCVSMLFKAILVGKISFVTVFESSCSPSSRFGGNPALQSLHAEKFQEAGCLCWMRLLLLLHAFAGLGRVRKRRSPQRRFGRHGPPSLFTAILVDKISLITVFEGSWSPSSRFGSNPAFHSLHAETFQEAGCLCWMHLNLLSSCSTPLQVPAVCVNAGLLNDALGDKGFLPSLFRALTPIWAKSQSQLFLTGWPLRFPPLSLFSLHWMFPLFFSRSGFS